MAMKAQVQIDVAARRGSTCLKNVYCTPPFKIADVTESNNKSRLHLMLMSSSPGVLDEDDYQFKITLGRCASLVMYSQSYQRLFTMVKSARQETILRMDEHASFCFLPHPVVPHKDSNFSTHNRLHLSRGCSLVWGEVVTCGRKLNGEIFNLRKYHSTTEVFISDRLVMKENLLIQPALPGMTNLVQMEGYTHQASLICLDENLPVKDTIKNISEYLNLQKDTIGGVTMSPVNGIIVRMLGRKAEQLHDCLKTITANYLNSSETSSTREYVY